MAIKDWTSKFSVGEGMDDATVSGMQTLMNAQDDTRVSQVHALRDSLIAVERQIGLMGGGAPWFEWNEADLSQFDSQIVGSQVSADVVAIESFAGVNWIGIDVTALAGTPFTTSVILPILDTPPSADYIIVADVLSIIAGSSEVGAGVMTRFDGVSSGYAFYYTQLGPDLQRRIRLNTGTDTQLGALMGGADLAAVNDGARASLGIRGTGTESLLETACGGRALIADTSPIVSVGQAALWATTNGSAVQTKNLFRNIRCYSLVS